MRRSLTRRRRASAYCFNAATVVGCSGTRRDFRNFVLRTVSDAADRSTSVEVSASASEIRNPVLASSPNKVAYVQGRNTLATLFHRADSTELQTEAHAYAGLKASVEGRREEALTHLRWVEEKGNRAFVEHKLARGELKRLGGGGSTPTAQGDAR